MKKNKLQECSTGRVSMRRRQSVLLAILLSGIFLYHVLSVNAVSKTYDWHIYGNTHYSVNLIVESPQFDSSFDVTVKLVLVSKDSSLDYTETKWMQITLDGVNNPLHIESERQDQTLTLNSVGDSWQRTFAFLISSSDYHVGRGQGIDISVIYKISIDEIDIPRHVTWNHLGENTNDPLEAVLSVPLLTSTELAIVLVIALIAGLFVARYIYLEMKKREMWEKERLRKETEERKREKMLADSFECPFCHTLYDKKLEKCPHCGAPKKL